MVVALAVIIVGISVVYLLTQPPSSVKTASTSTASATNSMPITASPTANTQSASRGVLSTYPVTITDSAGRSITLEKPARRIVAQSYAAWVLAALNATDTIVGTTDSAIRDPLLRHRLPRDVTSVGEFFGPGAKVSIEKILALQPDLVIAPTSYPAEELEAKLPPHIKVVRLDLWGVNKLFDEVEKLALLVNKTAEARRLIAKYRAVLEEIRKAVAGAERPAVYYEWYSDYNTVGKLNEWHNAIEAAGGRNVFGDLEQDSVRVSPEAVVARNPDVIIRREHARYFNPCFDNSTRRLEEVAKAIAERPGWAGVRAVREGRVYVISAAYQNGFGVIAHVAAIAKALHPDRLRGVDPDGLMLEWLRDAGVLQYCRGVRQWVYPQLRPFLKYPVVITDSDGRSITLERPARRIVAQTYAVWVLAALNATDRVVGTSMTSFRGDPAFMKLLPKDVADIGSFYGPGARVNVELIASLNPDVVIAPTTFFYPESELEAKLPPHIKVVRLDFTDVRKLAQEIRTLGVIVNKTAETERLAEKVERLLKLVKERVANATLRPKVYLEWYSPYSTPGRGSYWHELIELAGGVNVFSDLEVKGLQSFVQVSPEGVVQRAPDVIVRYVPSWVYNPCAARNATALARLRAEIAGRPGWSSIPAVANNRTYVVASIYDGGYGKAVHLVLLAKLIHPELFADIDVGGLFNDLLRTMGIDRYCAGARVWVYPPLK